MIDYKDGDKLADLLDSLFDEDKEEIFVIRYGGTWNWYYTCCSSNYANMS